MTKLFGIDVAKLVDKNISKGLLPGVLIKYDVLVRTTGSLSEGTRTSTRHTFKGIVSSLSSVRTTTIIENATDMVTMITNSIKPSAAPEQGDEVEIGGSTYVILGDIVSDPADATFRCQVR